MRKLIFCLCLVNVFYATIFGKIQGIVHDPQHRPMAGASVKLQAATSDWSQTAQADDNGEFVFTSVPVGDYKITVTQSKFETLERTVTVASGSSPILHFQLAIAPLNANGGGHWAGRTSQYGFGNSHYPGRPRGYRRDSGRGPHQQHGDDHRLRARPPMSPTTCCTCAEAIKWIG